MVPFVLFQDSVFIDYHHHLPQFDVAVEQQLPRPLSRPVGAGDRQLFIIESAGVVGMPLGTGNSHLVAVSVSHTKPGPAPALFALGHDDHLLESAAGHVDPGILTFQLALEKDGDRLLPAGGES